MDEVYETPEFLRECAVSFICLFPVQTVEFIKMCIRDRPSALKTYGSFILMTIGMIAVVYILLLLSRHLGRKIDVKRAKVKSDKIEKTDPDKNE